MSVRRFDVFNGDGDGICALRQLRLAAPAEAELVTGLKHEIALLERVDAGPGDEVTVLDVSLDRNREALERLLARGVVVRWFDHHYAGRVPAHPGLEAVLDPTGEACTSELVDRHVQGRFRAWAVAGAFGDNLAGAALRLAASLGLDADRLQALRRLGEAIKYNAYGATEADVMVSPARLYGLASRHADPLDLHAEPVIARLCRERANDLALALAQPAFVRTPEARIYLLPDAAWSRRVQGAFANQLALAEPHRVHAVLVPVGGSGLTASVRTPPRASPNALELCRRYTGGGGRPRAAGIERLDRAELDGFVRLLETAWRRPLTA